MQQNPKEPGPDEDPVSHVDLTQSHEEVIAAANAAGITMYFTGARHFFH